MNIEIEFTIAVRSKPFYLIDAVVDLISLPQKGYWLSFREHGIDDRCLDIQSHLSSFVVDVTLFVFQKNPLASVQLDMINVMSEEIAHKVAMYFDNKQDFCCTKIMD